MPAVICPSPGDWALQICIESLALAALVPLVESRLVPRLRREARGGPPILFWHEFPSKTQATACAKVPRAFRTTWEALSEFIIQGCVLPLPWSPKTSCSASGKSSQVGKSRRQALQKETGEKNGKGIKPKQNNKTNKIQFVSIWKQTQIFLC